MVKQEFSTIDVFKNKTRRHDCNMWQKHTSYDSFFRYSAAHYVLWHVKSLSKHKETK